MKIRPQCKSIPDEPILRFLHDLSYTYYQYGHISSALPDRSRYLLNAMPYGVNTKLAMAKMKKLMKRGLVFQYGNTRFALTRKGEKELLRLNEVPF